MKNISTNFIIGYQVAKTLNGHFEVNYKELKHNRSAKIAIACFSSLILLGIYLLFKYAIIPLLNGYIAPIENFIGPFLLIMPVLYIFSISPYFQNKKNYKIVLDEDIKIYYKNKLLNFEYVVKEDGKVDFKDVLNKNKCISYADGSKMSDRLKYQHANFIAMALSELGIMSQQYLTLN